MADLLTAKRHFEGRLIGLRTNRYSWWVHARELADFILPRRYKWLITPNQQGRGSPINQHILDSTGTIAARKCAAGMMAGISSPTRPWFRLKIGKFDSTQTSPVSLWLAEVERLLMLVFQESNFYTSLAIWYFDLVVFGTAVLLIYQDFDDVIRCYNPCFGEYYLDNTAQFRPHIFYREFVYTVAQAVQEFGINNVSPSVQGLYKHAGGAGLTREIIVAHAIEPNTGQVPGIGQEFKFVEVYWEWGGSASPQGGSNAGTGFLRTKGYYDLPAIATRWDLVSNDPYGRSPGMDSLPDIKQLQHEVRRKAQGIDKQVNPPLVADIMMKNQPASLIPGGVTYIPGFAQSKGGFAPVYEVKPDLNAMMEDLNEVRERIKQTFFNDLFQVISQYETRSNVSATEIDARRAEGLVLLGPVLERVQDEGLRPALERTLGIMFRVPGLVPPAPAEVQGHDIKIEYISMLSTAQQAAATSGIERILQIAGNLAGLEPAVMDAIDTDFTLEKYSNLLNNDPRLIRAPNAIAQIRQQRQQAQQQAQQAEMADKMANSAKNLAATDLGGGKNALQMMTGVG